MGDTILQACLNGALSRDAAEGVPITASDLARDALAVRRAGAEALHLHPRGQDGAESLAPEVLDDTLAAVRQAVPGMPVGVATGDWIAPGGAARRADIAAWRTLPDYASVNLSEPDAPEVMALLLDMGVGIEAGLWTEADARRFAALPEAPRALRVLIEPVDPDAAAAAATFRAVRAVLGEAGLDLPVLLHGLDATAWPVLGLAAAEGVSTRIGFEDTLTLPDGSPAPSNAALVEAARRLFR